jgi:LmbE family N-acetylglucosaminyl deacetylase
MLSSIRAARRGRSGSPCTHDGRPEAGASRLLRLELPSVEGGYRVLAIGAHSDDLEIGCGGTVLRLAEAGLIREARWVVLSGEDDRAREAEASAELFLRAVPTSRFERRHLRDGFFPYAGGELKDFFEELKLDFEPDLVLTHRREDAHQDHRLVSDLTWNTFRNHLILEYEVPKYDGDLRSPNFFVELPEELCRRKVEAIVNGFESQSHRGWFTGDLFWSLLRLRGIEACSSTGYAEGFDCRKLAF